MDYSFWANGLFLAELCVNIIWFTNLNKKQTNEIIKLQKWALRLIYLKNRISHTTDLFKNSGIIRFDFLFDKEMLDLMYKKQTNQLPSLIMKQLSKFGHSLNTRLQTSENYSIPHHFVKNNLIYDLLTAWNKTPKYIKKKKNSKSWRTFKQQLCKPK